MAKEKDPNGPAAPVLSVLDLDREALIEEEKEAGITFTAAEDSRWVGPDGEWSVTIANPRSIDVDRRYQKLERDWRRSVKLKPNESTPLNVLTRLRTQAVIERAVMQIRVSFLHKGNSLRFDTWKRPAELRAARKALVEVAELPSVREFLDDALAGWQDHGLEEKQGEG